ncbi:MAG: DUF5680 domain-containing protein [Candidatus Staskawiczbacteria bacterium]|jgi:hypothetical protein
MIENIKEEIEDKIIDYINSSVTGRLIVFKPDKKGMDDYLVVERRGKYKEDKIYLEINSLVLPAQNKNFIKDFSQEKFKADKNFYLIFAYFDEVTQKINDYIWIIPSLKFQDIAEVVKHSNNKKSLRFESSSNFKDKNKYSEFLINIKDLGDILLGALKDKKQAKFQAVDFDGKSLINLENLKEFLCNARQNTYAANSSGIDNPRLLESKQLEFQKGEYFYRDVYFTGKTKFIGQEIIYQDLKPIWGMNYIGKAIGKLETNFLKESLMELSDKCRLGQECEYNKREYKYKDKGVGDVSEFSGKEEILLNEKSIYKLDYQGGLIS